MAKWMQLQYTVRLQSPVLLTNSVGDENISLSHDYLPGSSLLGMFASLYIREHLKNAAHKENAHQDENFAKFFLSGNLRFLNGYPLSCDRKRTLPVPRSYLTPKKMPTDFTDVLFRNDEDSSEKKEDTPNTPRPGFCLMKLSHDAGRLDFERAEIKKSYHFHHHRTNQMVGRNVDGTIFNYEALERDQAFGALLVGEAETLERFQEKLGQSRHARLGRSKNTEYGGVEIVWETPVPVDVQECLYREDVDNESFAVTLLADAILLNDCGHSEVSANVFEKTLVRLLANAGVVLTTSQLKIEQFLQGTVTENYLGIWKARKPSMSALAMGSCFRVTFNPALTPAQEEKLNEALAEIQNDGIGIRRAEGFGRVAINWQMDRPISYIAPPDPSKDSELKKLQDAAEKSIEHLATPAAFSTIFKNLLWKAYRKKADAVAAKHLESEDYRDKGKFIAGAQMSRLQRFAATSPTEKNFHQKIENLSDTTKNALAAARNRKQSQTLLEFLRTGEMTDMETGVERRWHVVEEILQTAAKEMQIAESREKQNERLLQGKINYDPNEDENLRHELFRTYMSTFFALMSKKAREEEARKKK